MLTTLCLSLLPFLPVTTQEADAAAEAEREARVAASRADLAEAVKGGEAGPLLEVLTRAGRTADAEVVAGVAGLLKHRHGEVRLGALEALRFNADPAAADALLKAGKDRKLLADPASAEAYYMALGQKADPRAVKLLAKGLTGTEGGDKVVRARILALGRIRTNEAVEELYGVLVSGAGRRAHPQMRELHLALTVLTGAEVESNRNAWQRWWNDHRRDLEVSAELPELERRTQKTWERAWADPRERAKDRGSKKDAPESGGKKRRGKKKD